MIARSAIEQFGDDSEYVAVETTGGVEVWRKSDPPDTAHTLYVPTTLYYGHWLTVARNQKPAWRSAHTRGADAASASLTEVQAADAIVAAQKANGDPIDPAGARRLLRALIAIGVFKPRAAD